MNQVYTTICLVTQQYRSIRSGVGLYATNVVRYLSSNGYKVKVIISSDSKPDPLPGVEFITVKTSRFDPSPNKWVSFSFYASRQIANMKGIDIVHFTDAREALFYKKSKNPCIGNMNDYFIVDSKKSPTYYKKLFDRGWIKIWLYYNIAKPFEKIALKKYNLVICNTEFVKNKIEKIYNIPNKKLRVIYKSIDLSKFKTAIHDEKNISRVGEPQLLFVAGGNYQKKGLNTIIDAVSIIRKKYPEINVWVIGKDIIGEKLIAGYTGERGEILERHLTFLGNIDNDILPRYYHGSDIFVRPSFIEAFGVTYLEAMASGVPAIGGTNGGTKELIQHGENGFLVDTRDHESLAQHIIDILQDDDLKTKLIENGKKTAEKFSLESMMEKTIQEYSSILTV